MTPVAKMDGAIDCCMSLIRSSRWEISMISSLSSSLILISLKGVFSCSELIR